MAKGDDKKDDKDKIDPDKVRELPTYQPDNPTPYDKATKNPAPAGAEDEPPLKNGRWGGLFKD